VRAVLKALVPVDGSENSLAPVRHVIKLIRDREPLEVHLLNVQPPLHGDVAAFVGSSTIRGYHEDESAKALAPACALLDEAQIPYHKHAAVGHVGHTIAEWAKKLGCDKVIMGTRGHGAIAHLLMGSITREAIHQMDPAIPVTLVKAPNSHHAKRQHT
jgi:nucleotide-binding universal stress UspA family protein